LARLTSVSTPPRVLGNTMCSRRLTSVVADGPAAVAIGVVRLSNGEYEVHDIGVNWPHHIFVDQTFTVVGAD
jgi:hypothetical protein